MNETESAVEQVLAYLENRQYHALRQYLENEEAADVAGWFLEIPREYFLLLFRILPKELAAEVFVELEPDVQETLLKAFSDEELGQVVERLFVDDTVELIEECRQTSYTGSSPILHRKSGVPSTRCCNIPETAQAAV